jgi:3'(2'), 5'-bisphosphate nucleotidase
VRTVIPDATDDDVLGWIDRGAGDPPATFWTLDPVDGTKGFLRGDQYAVAFARIENGRVEVGALGCPELIDCQTPDGTGPGTVAVAQRGHGAWHSSLAVVGQWQRLTVSTTTNIADARLLRSVESAHTNTGAMGELVAALGINAPPVPLDSQAKYAVLAAGAGEALLRLISSSRPDYRERIWDQAAGSIVVEEAGGRVSDLDGKPLDFSRGRGLERNRGVLATNGHLHDALLAGLRSVGA